MTLQRCVEQSDNVPHPNAALSNLLIEKVFMLVAVLEILG